MGLTGTQLWAEPKHTGSSPAFARQANRGGFHGHCCGVQVVRDPDWMFYKKSRKQIWDLSERAGVKCLEEEEKGGSSDPKEESCRDGAALFRSCSITGPLMGGSMVAHVVGHTWV